jgi:hypothetical protein
VVAKKPSNEPFGLDAPLFSGYKFISQLLAAHLLVLCLGKFISCTAVRLGNGRQRGAVQANILWQGATIANGFLLMVFRLFTPAATSASLDLRFALMALAYEAFILGLYGFL